MTIATILWIALQSDDTYTMKVYVKASHKGNDVHHIKRAFADHDGIRNIAYENASDVIVFTMDADTILNEAQLKTALPDRYSVTRVELLGITGRVRPDQGELFFTFAAAGATCRLEKWDGQPQWLEYVHKHLRDAEGFRLNARVEAGAPGRGIAARPQPKLVVLHAQTCKVKESAADVPNVTLRFLVDEIDAREGKSLEAPVKSIAGVTGSEFDADAGILSLTIKADAPFRVADFARIISKKGKVVKVTIEGLTGAAGKSGSTFTVKAKGTGTVYELEFPQASNKLLATIGEKQAEQGKDVRISGEIVEEKDRTRIKVANARPLKPGE
jgi:hypothetical protein